MYNDSVRGKDLMRETSTELSQQQVFQLFDAQHVQIQPSSSSSRLMMRTKKVFNQALYQGS